MSTMKWIGGSSSNFGDRNNWSPQAVPGATADVFIEPAAVTAINASDATINSLTTSANVTLSIAATSSFTINDAVDAANPSGTSVNGGTINLAGAADFTLGGTFDNTGVLATAARSDIWLGGALVNTGTVRQAGDVNVGTGGIAGHATNAAGATWAVSGNVDIVNGVAGSTFTNDGSFARSGSGVTDVGVATINAGNATVGSGTLEFIGSLTNTGAIATTGGALFVSHAIQGAGGTLGIGGGGSLHLMAGADAGQTVQFQSAGALDLGAPGAFAGHIAGFAAGDLIDLVKLAATSEQFAGGVLTVLNGGAAVAHLDFNGSYTSANFSLSGDGHHGTLIHFV